MQPDASPLPLWIYRALLFLGGAAFIGVGLAYYIGEPVIVDPRAGRLSLGLAALSLGVLTFTSVRVRRHAIQLVYALFFVVSAWQIATAAAGGLTPTSALAVLLVFMGCSAGIQNPRLLTAYAGLFVLAASLAALWVEDPGVPRPAFIATLCAFGAIGVAATHARYQNIQRLKVAKEEAIAAARAKSEFLAAMSHEIRTPLNGVIGMTDVLALTPLAEDQREALATIQASGRALLDVINDVLDFSKIEAGHLELVPEPITLRDLADDAVSVVATAAASHAVEVVSHVDRTVPAVVLADGPRLRQVVLNLLSNAVKFTPSGTVSLSISARRLWSTAEVEIQVTDTGIGIPAEKMGTLFDSFTQVDASTTRRYGGTGLGLAISRSLVQAMGGTIGVESEPGRGSTFTVTVPLREVEGPPAPAPHAGTLLLVDDHDGARSALAALAGSLGLGVHAFATARQAHAWIEAGGAYDLAALDLALDRREALTLAEDLRGHETLGDRPLVALLPIDDRRQTSVLFDAVIHKPVRAARFRDIVGRLLGTHGDDLPAPYSPAPPDVGALRVLLVEDHEVNRIVAISLLRRLGIEPVVALDGQQALDALDASDYDLVLMDLQMPVLDGIEATRRLRATLPAERQPRVVALTANALSESHEKARAAGMDGFLTKPVRLDDLRGELERMLGVALPAPSPPHVDASPALLEVPTPETVVAHLDVLCEDDRQLAREILDAYLGTEAALTAGLDDPDERAGAAHKLKAACGTLGADALAHAAFEIERDTRGGVDTREAAQAMAQALGRFREVAQQARDQVATGATAR